MKQIRIAGTIQDSIVDGPGLRYAVFVQGCPHGCAGCHNPETHDFGAGRLVDAEELLREFEENPLCDAVTFSGGEPFCQAEALYELGEQLIQHGCCHIMCYSGWTFEELMKISETDNGVKNLLGITDILVDGRFQIQNRSLSLAYRGSSNQRIIDVKKSLSLNTVIETEL